MSSRGHEQPHSDSGTDKCMTMPIVGIQKQPKHLGSMRELVTGTTQLRHIVREHGQPERPTNPTYHAK